MTLKEYLERQLHVKEALIKTVQGEVVKDYFHSILLNEIDTLKGFLKELEEYKKPEETDWTPKVNEYCWFIEQTVEGEFLHFCKIISKTLQLHTTYYGGLEEEIQYRVLTSTEEMHEVTIDSLEKFEGTLPSVIREEED